MSLPVLTLMISLEFLCVESVCAGKKQSEELERNIIYSSPQLGEALSIMTWMGQAFEARSHALRGRTRGSFV